MGSPMVSKDDSIMAKDLCTNPTPTATRPLEDASVSLHFGAASREVVVIDERDTVVPVSSVDTALDK